MIQKTFQSNISFPSLSFCRAVFKVNDSNCWGLTASGKEFAGFKELFGKDERGFGYIRIQVRKLFHFISINMIDWRDNFRRVTRCLSAPSSCW